MKSSLKDCSNFETSLSFNNSSKKLCSNAIRYCVYFLLVFSFGLAIATISITSANLDKSYTTETTFSQLESRILGTSSSKYTPSACQILNCLIKCDEAKNIYEEVFGILEASACEKNITLKLDNQRFPNSILTNRWKPAYKEIKSVIIQNSEIKHIRNEAFNSFDFTETETVVLQGIQLNTLGNGVLLGFAKLQALVIEGRVHKIDRCFFQPVQASLKLLKIRAGLWISGRQNIFGVSYMSSLGTLDLSDNYITGTLARRFFHALPNLKYLTLSNSDISSIDIDAFDDTASHLLVLDLSNNHLKTLDVRTIEKIVWEGMVTIYLLGNDWPCECALKHLIVFYKKYKDRFGDVPYCKSPVSIYGALLTEVQFDDNCSPLISTPMYHFKTDSLTTTRASTDIDSSNPDVSFKMACVSMIDFGDFSQSSTNSGSSIDYFVFAPPCHDFEINLLEDNSVQVIVQYADEPINIIWFSEALENFVHTMNDITFDYNCETYSEPYLLATNLEENCTYTFCLVPSGTFSITPFNCLPLHVPSKVKPVSNVWISNDDKELTLGIVCLILMCSLVFGGIVAFLGIKAYPDVLDGSNHVFVVKKSNKVACYVSTITEGEYAIHKNSLKKKNVSSALLLPFILSENSPECRKESSQEVEDCYEMPCVYNKPHNCQQKCLFNKCIITPSSPPPLPKRNSNSALHDP